MGASIWADIETTLAHAIELVTPNKLKEISSDPFHEMVNCHVHKLVQVNFLRFPSPLVLLFLFNSKYTICP